MPRHFPVYATAQVKCSATGAGRCYVGPNVYGISWQLNLIQVTNDSVVNESQCLLYVGAVGPSFQYGGTWSGNMDTDSDPITLKFGDQLWAVWAGADANTNSQLLVSGVGTDQRYAF